MKLITLADWHIRSTVPLVRKDDYHAAQFRKVSQLIDWSNKYHAPILCPGDMLDSNRITFSTYNALQRELKFADEKIFVIRGNHDSYFHTDDVSGTPLQGLYEAGAIIVSTAANKPYFLNRNTILYACNWNDDPVEPHYRDAYNILMVHKAVFENEIPFYFKDREAYTAKTLKETFPGYDLYLAGDIHIPFVKDNVIVSGSMMRSTSIQRDFRPRAYLIDTAADSIQPLFFDIEEDVFHEELVETKDTAYSQSLEGLVAALKKSSANKADFKSDCFRLAEEDHVNKTLKEIFDHVEKNR